MKPIQSIPVPMLMVDLPRDRRGYLIPFWQYVPPTFEQDGKVDFRIKHPLRVTEALRKRLCGICGKPLLKTVYFLGGPDEVNTNTFTDPGMHIQCARYSLAACPFLANKDYRPLDRPIEGAVDDITRATFRPEVIVLLGVERYEIILIPENNSFAARLVPPVKSQEEFR